MLQQQRERFLVLVALAALPFVAIGYRAVGRLIAFLWRHAHDAVLARRAIRELRRLVEQFAELIDPNRRDTLQPIVEGLFPIVETGAREKVRISTAHWLEMVADRTRQQPLLRLLHR